MLKKLKICFFILSGISIIVGLIAVEDTDGISLLPAILVALILIGNGIFLEKTFKWKAYMLKNTHEINIKTR